MSKIDKWFEGFEPTKIEEDIKEEFCPDCIHFEVCDRSIIKDYKETGDCKDYQGHCTNCEYWGEKDEFGECIKLHAWTRNSFSCKHWKEDK